MVMRERSEPKKTHIRVRGNYDQLGQEVTREYPTISSTSHKVR
jgi:hypothetical protein